MMMVGEVDDGREDGIKLMLMMIDLMMSCR